ncbi:MAG: hypothetical protein ABI761_00685 [Saprospiraceae bacterium]
MGITIHYSGRFKQDASLQDMVDEVTEIADVNHWKYQIYKTDLPHSPGNGIVSDSDLYGMLLNVPECESIMLTFLDDRRLVNPMWLSFIENGDKDEEGYRYAAFTKTQFGGVEAHIRIIHLLKYLSTKYFDEFELNDEAQYWETGDAEKARKLFNFLGSMINKLGEALNSLDTSADESIDELANRINQKLKDFFDKEKSRE